MSGDAVVAGRLEIPVESSTKGFKERLKKAVEKAAEGVEAPVGVKVETKGLKKRLETAVTEASRGVDAEVGIKFKTKGLKAKLEAAVKAAGPVSIEADLKKFTATIEKRVKEVSSQKIVLPVVADEKGFQSVLARMKAKLKSADLSPNIGGGKGDKGKDGGGFKMPSFEGARGARSAFMPIGILGLASVIQPAIAAIVGSLGGLVAMAGSAAAAINVLGGAGGALGTLAAGFAGVTIAMRTMFSGKTKDLPKELRSIREEVDRTGDAWAKMREGIALDFWTPLKGQIEPTGKVLMPLLREGLGGVNEELGQAAKQTAVWMRSPLFKSQMGSIFSAMKSQASGFGDAIVGALKGIVNLTDAAGPMLLKFSGVMTNFGKWAGSIGNTPAKQRELGKAFEYGWQKASQLWDMTKNLGATLKGVFGAGRESGDRLLASLQGVIREWRKWATSTEGQERIKKWFDNVEPIARSAGKLIAELGKSIARLAEDGTTAGLLDKIRTELLPSLETFLRNLGTTLGPAVITFITNVLEVLTQMSAAGSPLGQGLSVINKVIGGIADIFQAHPELAKNVGILLGALLGFRALSFFSGLIPGLSQLFGFVKGGGKASWAGVAGGIALFSGALSGLPGPVQGAVAAISTLLTLVPAFKNFGENGKGLGGITTQITAMGDAARKKKGDVGGLTGAFKSLSGAMGYGVGAVGGGLKSAFGGLMGLLGGPWGVALVGASTAIGAFAQAQANAKADVDALRASLDEQTGSFTDASRDQVAKKLGEDVNAKDFNLLDSVGANDLTDATSAVLGDQSVFDDYIANLVRIRKENTATNPEIAAAANGLRETMLRQRDASMEAVEGLAAYNAAQGKTGPGAAAATGPLQTLNEKLNAMKPTATEVADALERLAGITRSDREAKRQLVETTNTLNETIARNGKVHGNATAAGRENDRALESYAASAVAAAEASAQTGASTGSLTKQLEGARAKFIASAKAAGYTEEEAATLATQMQLTGESAKGMAAKVAALKGKTVVVTLKGGEQVEAMTAFIQGQIDSVTGKTVSIHTVYSVSGQVGAQHAQMAKKNPDKYYGQADGGIIRYFADGGVAKALGRKVRSFANGAERHIAQIARGGEYRVWAEDETEGEAYIPLAQSKRGRSMEILAQVADEFGMALTPALSGAAAAAGSAYASASSGRLVDRPAVAAGPQLTIAPNAINVHNPTPEPASKSIVSVLRSVGEFGLFGEDD